MIVEFDRIQSIKTTTAQVKAGERILRLGLMKARSTAPKAVCILSGLAAKVYDLPQNKARLRAYRIRSEG
jgi:hypothetical protein